MTNAFTNARKLRALEVSIEQFGGVGDGATSCATPIADAIAYLTTQGGGTLRFGRGTYVLNNDEKIALTGSNIAIRGQGMGSTIIKRIGAGGTALIEAFVATMKYDLEVSDLTLDCNGINSGIQCQYVQRLSVHHCRIINSKLWGLTIGIGDGSLSTMVNSEIDIADCWFSGAKSTTENLLLFNSKNVTVSRCFFSDGMSGGTPAVGLYQNLQAITISNCHWNTVSTGLYYSISTNDITIDGCTFTGCGTGITGANQADNGTFGATYMMGLAVSRCKFIGNTVGMGIGATAGATVSDCTFRGNIENALVVSNGNAPVNLQPTHLTISGCQFISNNAGNGSALLHPGILFQNGGGTIFTTIQGCHFIDLQATPTQKNAIGFTGPYGWSGIRVFGCTLNAYADGTSIALSGGATVTASLFGCMNLTGLPAGITSV